MKIAFGGAAGSGKTTACYELLSCLKMMGINCSFASEAARNSHMLLKGDYSERMHLEIASIHITNEMRSEFSSDLTVCDRSIFDFLAFAKCRFKDKTKNHFLIEALEGFAVQYALGYDAIFLTNGRFGNVDNDLVRVHNVDIVEFDNFLFGLTNSAGLGDRTFILPSENRLEFVIEKLKLLSLI